MRKDHFKNTSPDKLLLFAYSSLLVSMLVCVVILPEGITANSGFSYFGSFKSTIVPYLVGYCLGGFFLYKISDALDRSKQHFVVTRSFLLFSIMLLGLAATPHNVLNKTHVFFGATLFSTQLLLSLWVMFKIERKIRHYAWVTLEFVGGLISAYYLSQMLGYMILGQLVFQIAFLLLFYDIFKYNRLSSARVD